MLIRPVLLWDGSCGFCQRWVERVERWDRASRIETMKAWDRSKYPELLRISDDDLNHAMHLALPDGRVFAGGRAVPQILKLLPGGRWVAWVFLIPGVGWITDRVYAWVAARRHKLGCAVPQK
ncbi:MAG: thiol-disulfide oxidoreductase DCC family protein [Gemmatimonadales bacterium]